MKKYLTYAELSKFVNEKREEYYNKTGKMLNRDDTIYLNKHQFESAIFILYEWAYRQKVFLRSNKKGQPLFNGIGIEIKK